MYTYKRLLTQCAIKALGLACVFGPNLAQAQVAVNAGVNELMRHNHLLLLEIM